MSLKCKIGLHKWEYSTTKFHLMHNDKFHIDAIYRHCVRCSEFQELGAYVHTIIGNHAYSTWISEKEKLNNHNIFYEIEEEWIKESESRDARLLKKWKVIK